MRVDFIHCREHVKKFFEGFAYREYVGVVEAPELGRIIPMVCLVGDLQHFNGLRSPFARLCRKYTPTAETAENYPLLFRMDPTSLLEPETA